MKSLGFSIYNAMSSADSDSFTSFSCLITLARTSNTVLNSSGESSHPCLFLISQEKLSLQLFTVRYDVNCELIINGLYCLEVHLPSTLLIGSACFYDESYLLEESPFLPVVCCELLYSDHCYVSPILPWFIFVVFLQDLMPLFPVL